MKQIDWLGWIAIGILSLFALVLITLLGTIKGIHISGPGGVEVQLETRDTAEDDDHHHDGDEPKEEASK